MPEVLAGVVPTAQYGISPPAHHVRATQHPAGVMPPMCLLDVRFPKAKSSPSQFTRAQIVPITPVVKSEPSQPFANGAKDMNCPAAENRVEIEDFQNVLNLEKGLETKIFPKADITSEELLEYSDGEGEDKYADSFEYSDDYSEVDLVTALATPELPPQEGSPPAEAEPSVEAKQLKELGEDEVALGASQITAAPLSSAEAEPLLPSTLPSGCDRKNYSPLTESDPPLSRSQSPQKDQVHRMKDSTSPMPGNVENNHLKNGEKASSR